MGTPSEIAGIQYLRGLAASFVVFYHLSLQLNRLDPSFQAFNTFQSGVDLFFVISGFVMVYSTAGGEKITAIEFAKKRIIRIVPLYWLATCGAVIVLIIAPSLVRETKLEIHQVIGSFFFFSTDLPIVAVGWTLNYEMFFYLIFTIGMLISSLLGYRLTVLFSSVALVFLTLLHPVVHLSGPAQFYTNPIELEFLFGMVLAVYLTQRTTNSAPFLMLTVAGLFCLVFLYEPVGNDRVARYGLLAASIVAFSLLTSWPKLRLLELVGDSSYSLYLSHFFVVSLFAQGWRHFAGTPRSDMSESLYYIVGMLFSILAGIGIWAWIEAPITGQLRRAFGR